MFISSKYEKTIIEEPQNDIYCLNFFQNDTI